MNSFSTLIKTTKVRLKEGSLESALNDISEYCKKKQDDPAFAGIVFGSKELDAMCQSIGRKCLTQLRMETVAKKETYDIVFVATELYSQGGHTAAIRDFIKASSGKKILVLLTDIFFEANKTEINNLFPKDAVTIEFPPQCASSVVVLNWLLTTLIATSSEQILFFHHMSDAVATAAMLPELGSKIFFYHHSDHRFHLGVFVSDVIHIDFRQPGFSNCRHHLGIENNVFIPLMSDAIESPHRAELTRGGITTSTSGGYKFVLPYSFDFAKDVLPGILKTTAGVHYHIGVLPKNTIEMIRQELQKEQIDQDRLQIIEWVPNLGEALSSLKIDVYIDSAPLGGCKSVVEAMAAGCPVVTHHNYHSRLFSNRDLAYDGAFCWKTPEQLFAILKSFDLAQLQEHSAKAHTYWKLKHSRDAFSGAWSKLINSQTEVSKELTVEPDRLSFYETNQLQRLSDLEASEKTASKTTGLNQNGNSIDVTVHTTIKRLFPPGKKSTSELLFFLSRMSSFGLSLEKNAELISLVELLAKQRSPNATREQNEIKTDSLKRAASELLFNVQSRDMGQLNTVKQNKKWPLKWWS